MAKAVVETNTSRALTVVSDPPSVWVELGLTPLGKKLVRAMAIEAVAIRDFNNTDCDDFDEHQVAYKSAQEATSEVIEEIVREASRDPLRHLTELAIGLRWRLDPDSTDSKLLDDTHHQDCSKLIGPLLRALIVAAGVDPARCDQDTASRHPVYGTGSHLVPVG